MPTSLRAIVLLLATLFSTSTVFAQVHVVDGDTLDVGSIRYRLHGIDAPEAGQKCALFSGGTWDCGKAATKALEDLVLGQNVVCDDRGDDGYGRVIAVCFANDVELNSQLIASGLAWAFTKYSSDYVALESATKSTNIGVWQANTQTPWDYRSARWEVALQESPTGCPIKGNISKSGHIYHAPWSPWYKRTKISLDKGERWFCDEAEAVAAGWRAPRWGR